MDTNKQLVDTADTKLAHKYLERRKQGTPSEDINSKATGAKQRLILAHRSKQPGKEQKTHNKTLHELFRAVTVHPDQFARDCSLQSSNDDLSLDSVEVPLHDSQVLFTETDVTLPSHLDGSFELQEINQDREFHWDGHIPDSYGSSSSVLVHVYKEMISIYRQLKAERKSQQQWEQELHRRERRLKEKEEAFGKLSGMEEMVSAQIRDLEQKHQQELSQLRNLLQEKSKENKRLKSSFDTIKELNDSMKKQLNEISEQNGKLETQCKRTQARLKNLKASSFPIQLKLMVLLLEWVLDGQMFSSVAGNEVKLEGQCLPPEVLLNERCLKVLPLLADQLHHTPLSEPKLLLNLLRLIYWTLSHMDKSTQHVSLSSTLPRIGGEVLKLSAQSTVLPFRDPDLPLSCTEATGPVRSLPFSQSPCPHTRILFRLILLRTITQADVLAQAVEGLRSELKCEESRGLFIQYGGVHALLSVLRSGRVGLHTPIDVLMQLTEQSRYLNPFLEVCSCGEFFRTASLLLKNPRLELQSLEKLSILLQKLSSIRKNCSLFESSSLTLQLQELLHKTDPAHSFLCLNLRSIFHNLK